jgi:hypothetical protein
MKSKRVRKSKARGTDSLLQDIQEDFFSWCGLLSFLEMTSNPRLIRAIESLDRALRAAQA